MFDGYTFDLIIFLSIVNYFFKLCVLLGGFYLILQKIHLRLQMRFLKNISDEIIKINDNCIEFSFKYKQLVNELSKKSCVEETEKIDEKLITDLEILRGKVKSHSEYLDAQLNAFPYGNPINFFYYSIKGKYLWTKTQINADRLLTIYQDSFMQDTLLQSDQDLVSLVNVIDISILDKKRIDLIVVSGIDLINLLEDHSKKLY